jgi:hypothetical protein
MNRLAYNRGYLCGAMDRVQDGGIGWRQEIQQELSDLKVFWLDPTNKPIDIGIEDHANRRIRKEAKLQHRFDLIQHDMRVIRGVDLRMVNISDFMVVNLDMEVHACGTYEELYLGNHEKKSTIIRVEQGIEACPDWLLGTVPYQMIFSTWPEVYKYLRHVAYDKKVDTFNRWYFFNFTGE